MNNFLIAVLMVFFVACGGKDPVTPKPPEPPTPSVEEMLPINSLVFKSGVWGAHKVDSITHFEKERGAKVDIISVFVSNDAWPNAQSTWYMQPHVIPADFKGTLNVAISLWPKTGNIDDAAAGKYNAEWEKLGRTIAAKYPDAYLRPGWEVNVPEMYWYGTTENAEKWKEAYRHAVNSLRKANDKFRICWVVGIGEGRAPTAKDATIFYPGDQWVDFIGFDVYDWWPPYTSVAAIKQLKEAPYSWDWWLDFVKKRNKKLVIPEWGIVNPGPSHKDYKSYGGDNPKFIQFAYNWMLENKEWIEMECYFQHTAKHIRTDLFTGNSPLASAEYKLWMTKLKK